MTDLQVEQVGPGGENTAEVLAANNGLGGYFNRISSGDIGNQNLNVGGGFGSAAWGGNGTDGNLKTNPSTNKIPMVAYGPRAYGSRINLCPINERQNPSMGGIGQPSENTESFKEIYNDIDIDDLHDRNADYILSERFTPVIDKKEAITYSVSILIVVLFWVFVGILFFVIYVRKSYGPKINNVNQKSK